MRHPRLPVVLAVAFLSVDIPLTFAKGGRGGGRGRSSAKIGSSSQMGGFGASKPSNHAGRSDAFSRDSYRQGRGQSLVDRSSPYRNQGRSFQRTPGTSANTPQLDSRMPDHRVIDQPRFGGQRPFSNQDRFSKEQRKLDHRLSVADKLRDNAARNGNQNLLDTADRMERSAYDHYDRRLNRIDGRTEDVDPFGPEPNAGRPSDLDPSWGRHDWGGDFDDLSRRELVEERKLQHQLDVAQHLRDVAARNGNENLMQTADRMQQMAIDRYQRQLAKFGEVAAEVPSVNGSR